MEALIEEMRAALNYDAETGIIWRGQNKAGGDKGNGYIRLRFKGTRYAAHRIAWALHYGEWPHGEIDHINRDRSDNRISNLRVVSRSENMRNRGRVAGVHKEKGRWRAYIFKDQKLWHLGMFACFGGAIKARRNAEIEMWGPVARTIVIVEPITA